MPIIEPSAPNSIGVPDSVILATVWQQDELALGLRLSSPGTIRTLHTAQQRRYTLPAEPLSCSASLLFPGHSVLRAGCSHAAGAQKKAQSQGLRLNPPKEEVLEETSDWHPT